MEMEQLKQGNNIQKKIKENNNNIAFLNSERTPSEKLTTYLNRLEPQQKESIELFLISQIEKSLIGDNAILQKRFKNL